MKTPPMDPELRNSLIHGELFASFLSFAISDKKTVSAFEKATGFSFTSPPKQAIERMIDDATGVRRKMMESFVCWATETLWGLEYAPDSIQELVKKHKAAGGGCPISDTDCPVQSEEVSQ